VIEGGVLTDLKIIGDERGEIRHFMRCDKPPFEQFGEVYFSLIFPDTVKAWHSHKEMTLNYVCVIGLVEIGLFDGRIESDTHLETDKIRLADHGVGYKLLTIPPGVWNGFRAPVGWAEPVLVANCASLPHDPDEIERYPLEEVSYNWGPHKVSG